MHPVTLHDEEGSFEVTVRPVERSARAVLFAVGGGGDPERHAPLLDALAARGFAIAAPRFERMASPHPTEPMLLLRARRLRLAGHFTFMDAPPPHVVDPMPAREEFLAELAQAIGDFAAG